MCKPSRVFKHILDLALKYIVAEIDAWEIKSRQDWETLGWCYERVKRPSFPMRPHWSGRMRWMTM